MDYKRKVIALLNSQELSKEQKEKLENIFPELKERGDEMIREELIMYFGDMPEDTPLRDGITTRDAMVWLEKQGKHESGTFTKEDMAYQEGYHDCEKKDIASKRKPKFKIGDKVLVKSESITEPVICTIKDVSEFNTYWLKYKDGGSAWWSEDELELYVEPKFKVGDWVIDKQAIVHQIERVVENVTIHTFGYDLVGGGYFNDTCDDVHLWTIQDAKDGDVLVSGKCIAIFKSIITGDKMYDTEIYCHLINDLFISKSGYSNATWEPATKEQRDLLFSKMKDAGYQWDKEKKELRKIENTEPLNAVSASCWENRIGDPIPNLKKISDYVH